MCITITGLTALLAGQVPMVFFTSVTGQSLNIGQTGTLTGGLVAEGTSLISAQWMTDTGCTRVLTCITVPTGLALLTVITSRVVKALQTTATRAITTSGHANVNVGIAFALVTGPIDDTWSSVVVLRTTVTLFTRVSGRTVAEDILRPCVQFTGSSMANATSGDVRARALATGDRSKARSSAQWISIITGSALLTADTGGCLSAANTGASLRVAKFTESVTRTALAVGVVPVTGLAFVACPSVGARPTAALSGRLVAKVVQRAVTVAVAS